jgi:hypothetical protein
MPVVEVTIALQADEMKYKEKFLCYDPIELREDDPEVDRLIKVAISHCNFLPTKITLKAVMDIDAPELG